MEIGFVTTHRYKNFGTFLQCYALQKVLSDYGHNVEIIDYLRCDLKKSNLERIRILIGSVRRNPIKHLLIFLNFFRSLKRDYLFNRFFKENFKLSPKSYPTSDSLKQNPPVYDIYIAGSDQIWNPNLNGFIEPYFLTFAPKDKVKISFASSIGISYLSTEQKQHFYNYLHDYKIISCREQTGVNLLLGCGLKNIYKVADPTFLLSNEFWSEMASKSSIRPKNYGLTYLLSKTLEKENIAKQLFNKTKRIDLSMDKQIGVRSILSAGPIEFLYLIKNSDFICTDSFHGVVFSIIFEKEFYVLPRHDENNINSQNSRIYNLLSEINLEERLIKTLDFTRKPINYSIVSPKIKRISNESMKFIQQALYQ